MGHESNCQRSRGSGVLQRQILSLFPPAPNTHIDHTRVNTIYLFTFHGCLKLNMTVTWTEESSTMSSPGSPFLPSCAHLNCIIARAPRPFRVGPIMSSGHPGGADAVGRNVSMVEWHKRRSADFARDGALTRSTGDSATSWTHSGRMEYYSITGRSIGSRAQALKLKLKRHVTRRKAMQ